MGKDKWVTVGIPVPVDHVIRGQVEARLVEIAYQYDEVHSRTEVGTYLDRILGEILATLADIPTE